LKTFLLFENESIVTGTQKVEQATQTCLRTCSTCTEIITPRRWGW